MPQPSGIPSIERFVGRLLVRRWCAKNPPEETMRIVHEQRDALAALIQSAGPRAATRVQIKRLPGLESSSTNYSLAMVADHLARVNRDIATTLDHLAKGEPCPIVVKTANYKPAPDARVDPSMDALDASIAALNGSLADLPALRASTIPHTHPWFGPLHATTWACFPAFHQAIHLKQAGLIADALR